MIENLTSATPLRSGSGEKACAQLCIKESTWGLSCIVMLLLLCYCFGYFMYHWFTINISWLTLSWIDVETSMFGAITLLINSFEKSLWQTCNCKIQSSLMYLLIIHLNWVEERGGTNCYKFLTIFILHHQCNDTSRWKGFPQFLTQVSRTIRVNKVVLWLSLAWAGSKKGGGNGCVRILLLWPTSCHWG